MDSDEEPPMYDTGPRADDSLDFIESLIQLTRKSDSESSTELYNSQPKSKDTRKHISDDSSNDDIIILDAPPKKNTKNSSPLNNDKTDDITKEKAENPDGLPIPHLSQLKSPSTPTQKTFLNPSTSSTTPMQRCFLSPATQSPLKNRKIRSVIDSSSSDESDDRILDFSIDEFPMRSGTHPKNDNKSQKQKKLSPDNITSLKQPITQAQKLPGKQKKFILENSFESYHNLENLSEEEDIIPTRESIGGETEAERLFRERIEKARQKYVSEVEAAVKALKSSLPASYVIDAPPSFERMSDAEMTAELEKFGFRFTNRGAAVSKLTRCWAAIEGKKKKARALTPVEFIRTESRYYEDVLIYKPIPLGALYREMQDANVKISISRLRKMLDDEGVAFIEQ